jgi:hypothetical protein
MNHKVLKLSNMWTGCGKETSAGTCCGPHSFTAECRWDWRASDVESLIAEMPTKSNGKPTTWVQDLWLSRWWLGRIPSSGIWRRMALARTDVSKELVFLCTVLQLIVTANVVPRSLIIHTHNGADTYDQKADSYKTHTASHLRRRHSS